MDSDTAHVSAVMFDYGGVVHHESREDYDEIDRAFGLPWGTLWSTFHDIPEYKSSREGRISRSAYEHAIRRALSAYTDDAGADASIREFQRRTADFPPVDPTMIETLGRLRTKGRVRLGLLSNSFPGGTERLRAAGVADLFDDIVVSGDVGLSKPDAAIYLLAATRLGVHAASCLMVDDQSRNVEGARAAGLQAHLYHRERHADLIRRLVEAGCFGARGL